MYTEARNPSVFQHLFFFFFWHVAAPKAPAAVPARSHKELKLRSILWCWYIIGFGGYFWLLVPAVLGSIQMRLGRLSPS